MSESTARPRGSLGLWMCTALVVGNMIGSGVFLLPQSLAPFGGISIVGWLVSTGGALCLALVFASLGSAIPKIGGPYAYAREGFGDFGGFLVAWSYWISIWTTNAALAVATVSYSTVFIPALGASAAFGGVASVALLWLLTAVNVGGVENGGRVQLVTTILKILPLAAIGLFGFVAFDGSHFTPFNPTGGSAFAAISTTVTLTLWAFLGLESASIPAGDVDDPTRTIPRATVIGTLTAAVIYIVCTVVVMGLIAPAELAVSNAPFADAAATLWGSGGRLLIGAGAMISCFGALNGWILLSGQMPRAAALDGLLPGRFAGLNKYGSPVVGLIFSSVISTVLIGMNYTRGLGSAFTFLIVLATLATLVAYALSTMTGLMISLREGSAGGGGQRPGGAGVRRGRVVIASLAFGFSLWAIIGAGERAVFLGFVLIVIGLPVYAIMRYRTGPDGGGAV
ncbi:MAG: amino acid permease [Gemmatimonadota bacterium]|nr:amino acid permease [Gemmatimonadota bacterium]